MPTILKNLDEYTASEQEIAEIKAAIESAGYWEHSFEWRISTVMTTRIEPKFEYGSNWFITTVKCEQEVMIPAASIERAIIFKNIYRDFQIELWFKQGWASHLQKKT